MFSCPRSKVDQPVSSSHRFLIMLHNEHGIAQVPQPLKRFNQLRVVSLVQSYARLIEDVKASHQTRANLCG